MTDKQIIDGVDVSGCDFYDKNKKYCLTLKMDTTGFKNPSCFSGDFQKCIQDSKVCPNTFCDNNPNCYYKQLKRKEQRIVELNKTIKAKEQECEELKKENYEITEEVSIDRDLFAEIDQLKAENDELRKTVMQKCPQCGEIYLNPIGAKLHEALIEIKEIAQYDVYTSRTDLCLKLNWIKKKISECEVGND